MSYVRDEMTAEMAKIVDYIITSTTHPIKDVDHRWKIANAISRAMKMSETRLLIDKTGKVKTNIVDPKMTEIYRLAVILKDDVVRRGGFDKFNVRQRQVFKNSSGGPKYRGAKLVEKWEAMDFKWPFDTTTIPPKKVRGTMDKGEPGKPKEEANEDKEIKRTTQPVPDHNEVLWLKKEVDKLNKIVGLLKIYIKDHEHFESGEAYIPVEMTFPKED